MRAQCRDGRRENSDKFSARNERHRKLYGYGFDQRLRWWNAIGSKYLADECAWRAVIGWQDPIALDDVREGNSALSRQFTVRPHNEDNGFIEQNFGMEVVMLSRGPRHQQIDPAFTQLLDLMFARIGQLHVELNPGILRRKIPHDWRHQTVLDDVGASQLHFARIGIGQMLERAKALLHLVENIDAAAKQHLAVGRELGAVRAAIE